ncbi:MAG: DivIVA domain-containing protein [Clostridia bacterium]|nr:DivIVA domain-containing protein [Clostridia bacterium]
MLTPTDIAGKEFSKALNGYNKSEVEDFLNKVSEQVEGRTRELDYLKIQTAEMEKKIAHYQSQENSLKEALLVAQITSNDIKKKAEDEADSKIKYADAEASKIMKLAEQEAEEILSKAKRDADKNLEQAKEDYKEILNATDRLKRDYLDFKEKYQHVLREQINILDRLVVKDELTD